MSKLDDSYRKITTPYTQSPVINLEEFRLINGDIFSIAIVDTDFGVGEVSDFVMKVNGAVAVAVILVEIVSTSELYKVDYHTSPVFTGGANANLVQQMIGNPGLPEFEILGGITVSDPGDIWLENIIRGESGSSGKSTSINNSSADKPFIILPGQEVLFRVTNQGTAGKIDFYGRFGHLHFDT